MISICSWMGLILWEMVYLFLCCSYEFFWKLLTKKYIVQFTKYEHKGVSEGTDFNDRNFSSVECSEKDQTYISNISTIFEYTLRIKM